MTKERDARILDKLPLEYNAYHTKDVKAKLIQARAAISMGLFATQSKTDRDFYGKAYEIIRNAMLEIIYLDKDLKK